MQERHDNDEIESHNHNEYPLLYKEAEISTSSLGKFLECRKCYILLVTCALVIYLICMPSALEPAALGLRAYISGKSLVPMLQLLHVYTYVATYIRIYTVAVYICTYIQYLITHLVYDFEDHLCRFVVLWHKSFVDYTKNKK